MPLVCAYANGRFYNGAGNIRKTGFLKTRLIYVLLYAVKIMAMSKMCQENIVTDDRRDGETGGEADQQQNIIRV